MSHQHNPKRDEKRAIGSSHQISESGMRKQDSRHNPHRLLRIVRAMTEAVGGCGQQLSASKEFIRLPQGLFMKNPVKRYNDNPAENHTDQRRDDNECQSLRPTTGDDDTETRL